MTHGNPLNGYIDECSLQDGNLLLEGWLLHKSERLSHVSVFVGDTKWIEVELEEGRPDVQRQYPQVPHSSPCSVRASAPAGGIELRDGETIISFVAKQEHREMGTIDIPYVDPTLEMREPRVAPEKLRKRVHGESADVGNFLVLGRRCYSELRRHVERYRRLDDVDRILDWGCGCGRVWRHLSNDMPASRLYGCDIDSEAIDWMRSTYRDSSFTNIEHVPPTPYEDGFFDLVFGVSVLTHMDEAAQFAWLSELRRITRRDGIVAVSVLGEAFCPKRERRRLRTEGFLDLESPQSGDFAPFSHVDYYRSTYHTPGYIEERWSEYFEIVDHIEQALVWHQDLVLMRKARG